MNVDFGAILLPLGVAIVAAIVLAVIVLAVIRLSAKRRERFLGGSTGGERKYRPVDLLSGNAPESTDSVDNEGEPRA